MLKLYRFRSTGSHNNFVRCYCASQQTKSDAKETNIIQPKEQKKAQGNTEIPTTLPDQSTQHPIDHVNPPTKSWKYFTNKFSKFIEKYELKLEKKSPKVFDIYKTTKCIRFILSDIKTYFKVAKEVWGDRELHTFTRRELECYLYVPRDMPRILRLLLLVNVPFLGYFFVAIGYMYPKYFFTHHLWNEEQKQEFGQYYLTYRLAQYRYILSEVEQQAYKHLPTQPLEHIEHILHKIKKSEPLECDDVTAVKHSFETFPFSIDALPTVSYRRLAKVCQLSTRRKQLPQDGVVLLHIDRAMAREGVDTLTQPELCQACLRRGLNPYGLSQDEQIQFLKKWTDITAKLDENSISLLLFCPALLTYNYRTNINLMKGRKYRWHLGSLG